MTKTKRVFNLPPSDEIENGKRFFIWDVIPGYANDDGDVIRPKDTVRCKPPHKNSFKATVQYIRQSNLNGDIEVTVIGGPGGVRHFRTFDSQRITKL